MIFGMEEEKESATSPSSLEERVSELEARLGRLEREMAALAKMEGAIGRILGRTTETDQSE